MVFPIMIKDLVKYRNKNGTFRRRKAGPWFRTKDRESPLRGSRVSRGDWLGNPANFKGTFCCFGFDVEMHHHVTMTLHSLFQSKMADGADFLNGDDLEAILDILEADKEMEEEFINEDENVSTRNTIITYYFGERERKMTRKPEHLNTNV